MDHHCPWTANCVGHRTYPHFIRFLSYAVAAMLYLMKFLYIRLSCLWDHRNMSSTYGPSTFQLTHLTALCLVNFITLFTLSILLVSSVWALGANVFTIEAWEIERHEKFLRRARRNGGLLSSQDGRQIALARHEYPYDIGIWNNICQGMGSRNVSPWSPLCHHVHE